MNRRHPHRSGLWRAALLLAAATLTLGACARHQAAVPRLDVTFLPQKGAFISPYGGPLSLDDVLALAGHADYILVGEGHRNVVDHQVQRTLLKALAGTDRPPAVGLEMVAVDKQSILNDFGKGQVELDALPEELDWARTWGYPFSLFRPLFAVIRRDSLPVAGLNVPPDLPRIIARKGLAGLNEDQRHLLPGTIVPPSRDQLAFLDEVFAQHERVDADNATARERFRLVQSVWDSKMAEQAVRLRREFDWPVFVVAGAGHVENGWGIARRIRRFDPGARILSILPWRGGPFDADAADVFFYSPDSYVSKMGAVLTDTGQGGLLVEQVTRGSRADRAGLRPGDVLLAAAGVTLDHLFDLHRAGFAAHKADQPLVFTVRRGNETLGVDVGRLGVNRADKPKPRAKAKDAPGGAVKKE